MSSVLIVDDQVSLLHTLSENLRERGYDQTAIGRLATDRVTTAERHDDDFIALGVHARTPPSG